MVGLAWTAVWMVACTPPVPLEPTTPGPPAAGLDWSDASPIVAAHCAGCHQPGAVSGISLATYDDVRVVSGLLGGVLEDQAMPPWFAGPGDVAFANDLSLDPDDRQLLIDWADAEAPLGSGDPDQVLIGAPPPTLDRVDATLSFPAPFTPDFSDSGDDHRCFVIEADLPEWITGSRIVPGNRTTVHHAKLARLQGLGIDEALALDEADPGMGFDCDEDASMSQSRVVTWAPGQDAVLLPEGSGLPLGGVSTYLLVIHYSDLYWDGQPDETTVELRLEDTVERSAAVIKLLVRQEGEVAVAAGVMDQEASTYEIVEDALRREDIDPGDGVLLHSMLQHMHVHGRSGRLSMRQGADETTLLNIPAWNFEWQLEYHLAEPLMLPLDAELRLECRYDNPGDSDVLFGQGSTDEMCGAEFFVTEP